MSMSSWESIAGWKCACGKFASHWYVNVPLCCQCHGGEIVSAYETETKQKEMIIKASLHVGLKIFRYPLGVRSERPHIDEWIEKFNLVFGEYKESQYGGLIWMYPEAFHEQTYSDILREAYRDMGPGCSVDPIEGWDFEYFFTMDGKGGSCGMWEAVVNEWGYLGTYYIYSATTDEMVVVTMDMESPEDEITLLYKLIEEEENKDERWEKDVEYHEERVASLREWWADRMKEKTNETTN